ncbi:E3 ubiquitin-protein ligase SHPRH [Lamellibrachia satsuma]|nr:E3 ubiquitin-protein ligase SHPRH [Lamellibrachia satsuma]
MIICSLQPPIPSGATLIISPRAISHQWVEEIEKHVRQESLKVLVYCGVNQDSFIQPLTLARQDIVITSYETLRREINYVDLPHSNSKTSRRLRRAKRFMAVPSPIIAVEWWRICLDEAQMVECVTTKTAEMALRLSAVNRWCVTGTPIQRDIDDLYGLMLFLGVEPYWIRRWWSRILYEPYRHGKRDALEAVVMKVLWRTAKKDVLDQLSLPAQTEDIHWLTFSPVEEHFYRSQYNDSTDQARKNFRKWKETQTKLSSLTRRTLHHVAALNGLAGLHIIKQEYSEAAEKYRSVMRSVEEHKDELRTDELQQLHTLHNMDELLKGHGSAVAPTLRDSLLSQQANEVREKYLVKAAASVTVAEESWVPVRTSVSELKNQLARGSTWWADLIQWVNYRDLDMALVEKVTEDLAANATSQTHISAFRFRESLGLQFLLASHIEQLDQSHDALVNHLHMLSGPPSESVVNAAVECCLRPVAELLKNCAFCKADELFQDYESKLFSFVDKGFTQQTSQADDPMYLLSTRRQGTWADSETERALKSLNSFCKNFGADRKMTEFGNIHFKLLDALKKEFKCLRTVWKVLREQVSAMDELSMATTRIRLRLEDEPLANPPQKNILEEHNLETERIKFVSDQIVAQCLLKKKLGQLLYLKNLAQTQDTMTGGMNPEPCPICQKELGSRWSVLQCGHCFCLECIHILVQEYSFGGALPGRKALEEEITKVKGDNSTKIEGIVQCLLQIQQSDPTAKCLVFSTWVDVLNVLGQALSLNNIPFRSLQAGSKFQENLAVFRHDDDIKVLLLPVHSGANGLNLIEATHVLLVEPILNPAQELQAIGRVHRIGQTRSTVVHRFLVRGTIEERMHSLLQNAQSPVNCHNSSETTMTIADLMSLFEETADGGGQDDTNQHSRGQDASGQEMVGQQLPEEAMVGEEHVDEVVQTDDSIQGQGVRVQGQMEDTVIGQEVRVEGQTEDTVLGLEGRVEGQTESTVLGQEVRVEGQTDKTQ